MAKTSTLGSPGVEVLEIDSSVRVNSSTAVTAYNAGYAAQGPVEEVVTLSSMDDFVQVYGEPTNAAERYFYYTTKAIFAGTSRSMTVYTSRLPYGKGKGDNVSTAYTALAYPARPVVRNPHSPVPFDCFVLEDEAASTSAADREFRIKKGFVAFDDANAANFLVEREGVQLPLVFALKTLGEGYKGQDSSASGDFSASADISLSGENPVAQGKGYYSVSVDAKGVKTLSIALSVESQAAGRTVQLGTAQLEIELLAESVTVPVELQGTWTPASLEADTFSGRIPGLAVSAADRAKYPASDYDFKEITEGADAGKFEVYAKSVSYVVGAPATFQLSLAEFAAVVSGEVVNWSDEPCKFGPIPAEGADERLFGLYEAVKNCAFLVLNTARSTVNDKFEGFYLGMSDNMFVSPSDDYTYNAVLGVKVTTQTCGDVKAPGQHKGLMDAEDSSGDFDTLSSGRLSFDADGNSQGSISRMLERAVTDKDTSGPDYDDTLSIGLLHIVGGTAQSAAPNKLSYSVRERFNASLGRTRVRSVQGSDRQTSCFIENVIDPGRTSNNLQVMVNPFVYNHIRLDSVTDTLHGKVRVYGTKLVDNMAAYQRRYLSATPSAKMDAMAVGNGSDGAAKAAGLVATNASSYAELVERAGVTPAVLSAMGGTTFVKLDAVYAAGTYTTLQNTSKVIGSLPYKLERALQLVENDEEFPDIDIVVDGGLSTIYAYSNGNPAVGDTSELMTDVTGTEAAADEADFSHQTNFLDTLTLEGIEDLRTGKSQLNETAEAVKQDWNAVQQVFLKFCNSQASGGRGDSFYIGDLPRGVFVKGKGTKVQSLFGTSLTSNVYSTADNVNHSWSTSIVSPVKHLTDGIVSTYCSMYAQWVMVDDAFSGKKVWIPASGYVAALMGATDQTAGPWLAAAGLKRGVVTGVVDIALNPNPTQRTDLYKLCINSIPKVAGGGIAVWGIRTMSKADTAFDQNTCRRTFLYMEKRLKQYLRYYVFDLNDSYTRLNVYNDIDPFLGGVQAAGGIYSYTIVCDESNNTPDIINNGDLAVDVSAAPTRTAENIVLTMNVNKYTSTVTSTVTQ